MDEENLVNQQVGGDDENNDNETSTFPIFQQKQVAEFIKSILGDNYSSQKAFRDKFNRCLSLFAFYLSHMYVQIYDRVTVMKIENKKKKNEKIKQQITKNDIIAALKMINFSELADSLENIQIQTPQKKQNGEQQEGQEMDNEEQNENENNNENENENEKEAREQIQEELIEENEVQEIENFDGYANLEKKADLLEVEDGEHAIQEI